MKKFWIISFMLVASFANASTYLDAQQAPGYYRIKLGKLLVTAVSDGTVNVPFDKILTHTSKKSIHQALQSAYLQSPVETSINTFVIDDGKQQILVDAGAGDLFGDLGGHLLSNLAAAGYPAESIDAVLLTHIHADHSGGVSRNGHLAFPNATVYVDQHDADFWLNEKNISHVEADQRHTFADTQKTVGPVKDAGKLTTFQAPVALFPGIQAIPAPGHTPGSVIYKVSSAGKNLVLWGDIIHIKTIQLPSPSVAIHFDVNQQKAVETRKKVLQQVVKEGDLVAAAHISFPGFGHVVKAQRGYRWLPVEYTNALNSK
ncbi:putative quorum-quenching lactonase YtnP [Vibrio ruber DSM 16370]|uniref:Putative quorum-quenching lactonase YtnP n=2 Tax=Vibrio ruber TaxID=184755 RepID=A0A1R4LCL7_VIBR1|nr:putative quorum-quenching lactonase YtnP [Vibrio ruber DSM 16370]